MECKLNTGSMPSQQHQTWGSCKSQGMFFTQAFASGPIRAAYIDGICDAALVIPSDLLFGLVCGVVSVNAGLTNGASLALAALAFARL